MTTVKIKRENGHITAVSADGHTDYGEEGEDVVCAALSSVLQTAVLGLLKVAAVPIEYKILDTEGSLEFRLPEKMTDVQRASADTILETMLCGVADLNEGFSRFIKLEVTK